MFRKIVFAPMTSPFVIGCVDAFRDAYARTGMNLLQSIAVLAVKLGLEGWRGLRGWTNDQRPTTNDQRPTTNDYLACF